MTDLASTSESDRPAAVVGSDAEVYSVYQILRKPISSPAITIRSGEAQTIAASESLLQTHSYHGDDAESDDKAELMAPEHEVKNADKTRGLSRFMDWWWEMGACIISIVGCCLLVTVITLLDQQSRSSWDRVWPIQPNTVLAIISTISRTAMMVPVASCLSQLKWRHFQRRRHPLSHLDLIDRSSRGPWGSLQVLLRLGRANMIISVLAVTTILSLAVGPSVQQILGTGEREVPTEHQATVSYATDYVSKATSEVPDLTMNLPPTDQFDFFSALIRGIVDPVRPNFSCSTQKCTWPEFTTLGLCALQEDLTAYTTRECGPIWSQDLAEKLGPPRQDNNTWAVNCTYKLPAHSYDFSVIEEVLEYKLEMDWIFRNLSEAQSDGAPGNIHHPQYLRTNAYRGTARLPNRDGHSEEEDMQALCVDILATHPRTRSDPAGPPEVSVHRTLFYHCAQTYFGTSTKAGNPSLISTSNFTETLRYAKIPYKDGFDEFQAASNEKNLSIHSTALDFIINFLQFFFSSLTANVVMLDRTISFKPTHMVKESQLTLEKTLGPWVWHNGVERAIQNIATTVSSLIRNNELGDNTDAQMLEGVAWESEAYFTVRWAWMTIIVAETLCVTALLAMTMLVSWKDDIVKDSNFALLVHGLEGGSAVHVSRPETTSSLDKMAKGMTAKLEAGEDGVLRFQRQDREGDGETPK